MIIPFLCPDPRHVEMLRTIERARREVVEAMHVDLSAPRGTFSRPVVVDEVRNHTELAHRITEARAFERLTGVKTPIAIEQIIQSWELDR